MAEYHQPPSHRAHGIAAGGSVSPLDGLRRNYARRAPEEPSPREIVARLHAQIAAKSPEHATLVAEFQARQQRGESRDG
jgi:hypothetical protein